ncbi:unnamed protein product [Dicrocoelium dendriticum]|nr:unnamed protein product [Dicrocoelium dendriticum]
MQAALDTSIRFAESTELSSDSSAITEDYPNSDASTAPGPIPRRNRPRATSHPTTTPRQADAPDVLPGPYPDSSPSIPTVLPSSTPLQPRIRVAPTELNSAPAQNVSPVTFRCDQCPRTFRLRSGLLRHKAAHARNPVIRLLPPITPTCSICQQHFQKIVGLSQHMRHVHPLEYNAKCMQQLLHHTMCWSTLEDATLLRLAQQLSSSHSLLQELLPAIHSYMPRRSVDSIKKRLQMLKWQRPSPNGASSSTRLPTIHTNRPTEVSSPSSPSLDTSGSSGESLHADIRTSTVLITPYAFQNPRDDAEHNVLQIPLQGYNSLPTSPTSVAAEKHQSPIAVDLDITTYNESVIQEHGVFVPQCTHQPPSVDLDESGVVDLALPATEASSTLSDTNLDQDPSTEDDAPTSFIRLIDAASTALQAANVKTQQVPPSLDIPPCSGTSVPGHGRIPQARCPMYSVHDMHTHAKIGGSFLPIHKI